MHRVTAAILSTTPLLLAACRMPPPAMPLTALCVESHTDTTQWRRRSLGPGTVLLPPAARPDTGVMASLVFYHGGGRWLDHDLVVQYGFINQDSPYGLQLPPDWIPAPPACWPPPTGWDVRAASGRRNDHYYVQAWLRRPGSTGHWLTVWAEASDREATPVLYAVVSSVRPDSTLFEQVR